MFTSLRVLAYVVSLSLATHAVAQNTEGETESPEGPTSSEAQADVGDSQAVQTPTFSATPQPSDDPAPGDWAARRLGRLGTRERCLTSFAAG